MFKRTTAQAKISKLRNRVRVIQGGTSSSKTFSILPLLIDYALTNAGAEISIVAESIPHLRRGAMRDFLKILEWTNNYIPDEWNASSFTYRFSNKSYIEFFSAGDESKLRGARRDVLFINEANNINWESYYQLAIRTRKFIYLDYNPTSEFWAHTELIGNKNTDFIILTYKDNEALEPAIVKEIEAAKEKGKVSEYWRNWWQVYGLGQIGSIQGAVFSTFAQVSENEIRNAELVSLGLDWGFTNDPTALIAVYRKNGKVLLHELIYETSLTNKDIGEKLKSLGINKSHEIIADSAEPKSIEEMRRMGFRVTPSVKGKDSVRQGIDILQRYDLQVTETSLNLIKELRNYKWATDKSGKALNEPNDSWNHAIDSIRYVALLKLKTGNSGKYFILQA
jgi:phage terminase large subunit